MRTNKRVSAVVVKDGKILLIHRLRDGSEYWITVGGGVESNESVEHALAREVSEETGLSLIGLEFISRSREGKTEHYLYMCQLSDGSPCLGGPEKDHNCKDDVYILEWVEIDRMNDLDIYPEAVKQLF